MHSGRASMAGDVSPAPALRRSYRLSQPAAVARVGGWSNAMLLATGAGFLLIDAAFAFLMMLSPIEDGLSARWSPAVTVMLGACGVGAILLRVNDLARVAVGLVAASVLSTVAGALPNLNWAPSFAALFALAVLVVEAIRRHEAPVAALLTGAAGIGVAALASAPAVGVSLGLVVFAELGLSVAIGVGLSQRWGEWRRSVQIAGARNEERLAIARELHDTVGHHVTAIAVQAQAALHLASSNPSHDPSVSLDALTRIEAASRDALGAMRHVVVGLRGDAPTAPVVTWDELEELVESGLEHGDPITARIDPAARLIGGPIPAAVHRIVVESLTNVRKHGRGVHDITVEVELTDEVVVVTVSDDGTLSGKAAADSFGLVGMRERAEALGGSLVAGPKAGGGWIVRAELPRSPVR